MAAMDCWGRNDYGQALVPPLRQYDFEGREVHAASKGIGIGTGTVAVGQGAEGKGPRVFKYNLDKEVERNNGTREGDKF